MPETNDVISHLYYDLNDRISDIDSRVGDTESRLDDIDIAEATEPKVYVALPTQSGTDAPVATVLKNTLGGEVVWTYVGIGYYRVEAENCALLNILLSNCAIYLNVAESTRNIWLDFYDDGDGPLIDIVLKNLAGVATNIMSNQLVKIEVYP